LAEGVGFEPTVGLPTAVFKTAAIVHSATPPRIGGDAEHARCGGEEQAGGRRSFTIGR
jgi:hypothetical protein